MLSFEPNIVIVDDKVFEVEGIIDFYKNQGIGCKFFNANLHTGDNMPENPYCDINLIYLDVHYTDNIMEYNPEFCSGWIQALIPENSFYVLIIWSKETEKTDEILNELKKIKRLPYSYIDKSKSDYVTASGFDFERLNADIFNEINRTPALSELQIWKKSILAASNLVIGHLSKDYDPVIITDRLKKIILSHGGKSLLINHDPNRKRMVLFDALDHILVSNSSIMILQNAIDEVNATGLYSLIPTNNHSIDKELNSWFHFKLSREIPPDLLVAGLISEMNDAELTKLFSIRTDERIEPRLFNQLKEPVVIQDIVMVISSPCDIAQAKYGRNVKLISGLLLKNLKRFVAGKSKGLIDFNGGNLPESTIFYDHLWLGDDEDDCSLLFDFRYVFSVPVNEFHAKFHNLKIFNKELVSEILVKYSNYSNRLGITQII